MGAYNENKWEEVLGNFVLFRSVRKKNVKI